MMLVRKIFFPSDDVSMLGHGCGLFCDPTFYYQHLKNYQFLPPTYLGSFEGDNKEKWLKKMGVRLGMWILKRFYRTVLK